jgi:hypothetical protein
VAAAIIAVGADLPDEFGRAVRVAFSDGDCSTLVAHLETAIGKSVTGIVVYGSMAARPLASELEDSDVDLLVLVEEAASGGVFGRTDGVEIDLHVQSRSATLSDPIANWIYAEGRVLFDPNEPELEYWLESLRKWKHDHADPWTDADHLRNRVWAQRLVERVIRLGAENPAVAADARGAIVGGSPHAPCAGETTAYDVHQPLVGCVVAR